jgi:glycosyltransferase involved in cell wall biosynthesis
VDGYLESIGDVDAMAHRVIELLDDPERRQAYGRAGRERATTDFSRERIVDAYEAYYRRILGG